MGNGVAVGVGVTLGVGEEVEVEVDVWLGIKVTVGVKVLPIAFLAGVIVPVTEVTRPVPAPPQLANMIVSIIPNDNTQISRKYFKFPSIK